MRLAVIAFVVACAPQIDGPIEHQRALDAVDGDRLALQLAQLPGAVGARATLHRPVVDPVTRQATPAAAAIVVVVDDRADRAEITRAARALVRGTAPEIAEPAIVVELGAVRATLARVGPFTVEAGSKSALVVVLGGALGAIAVLAGWIAMRERRRA